MEHPALRGRSILVVEDEVLIAMDIVQALERAGASATMTTTVRHALILVEHDGLSAAIMDHALSDGDSTKLCARLSGDFDPEPGWPVERIVLMAKFDLGGGAVLPAST
jgi:CheY-like chemotaxis protein